SDLILAMAALFCWIRAGGEKLWEESGFLVMLGRWFGLDRGPKTGENPKTERTHQHVPTKTEEGKGRENAVSVDANTVLRCDVGGAICRRIELLSVICFDFSNFEKFSNHMLQTRICAICF